MGLRGKILRKLLHRGSFDSYIARIYSAVEERRHLLESNPSVISRVLELSSLLKPYDPKGKTFIRLGNKFDGGYVIVDTLERLDSVLSLGVGSDISFEVDLSKYVKRIDFYDYSVDRLPVEISNSTFFKLGVSGTSQPGFVSLEEAVSSFGIDDNILLKMDIESSEWDVLKHTPMGQLLRFHQIVVEFHGLLGISSEQNGNQILSALQKLNETHKLVHLHVNNYEPVIIVAGVPIPNVLEATYLRADQDAFEQFSLPRGSKLNLPNNPDKLDVSTRILF